MPEIDYIGEGATDEAIARRLILAAGATPGTSYLRPSKGTGRARVEHKLAGLNRGARYGRPVLALIDLDGDICAAGLVARLLPERSARMLLRIAVRGAEAWLMADREAYARHLCVPVAVVPPEPETQHDLKQQIIGWARAGRHARLARVFEARRGAGLADWQIIAAIQTEFVEHSWDPGRAADAGRAPSLSRGFSRLRELVARETSARS